MNHNELIENNRALVKTVNESTNVLKQKLGWDSLTTKPLIGVVLGSGLGAFCDGLKDKIEISFNDIPHIPASAVPGHAGKWVVGKTASGVSLFVMQGRIHAYEGHDLATVTLPIRLMAALGLKRMILTNAAGSVNPTYKPGEFVAIDDHMNLGAWTPLTGIFDSELGQRFVDMSEAYELAMNERLVALTNEQRPDIKLHRGVYCGVRGPQYETPAEIRMMGKLGGDVVGMSTVTETIVARQCGMKVNCISCVTNFGSGLSRESLSHEDVSEMGRLSASKFTWLVEALVGIC